MKVFIMTDLEGISQVDSHLVWDTSSAEYGRACERLIADTNAAVQGAIDAGATEILVFDGHGGGHNFPSGMLDARATQVYNYDEPGLFEGCAALLDIGLHAMAGTMHAFLDHTQSSKNWYRYSINGRPCGELAQEAAYCGAYGVPVAMVSGDDAACREACELIEGIEYAVVKYADSRYHAKCVPAQEAEARIRAAARQGVLNASRIKPFRVDLPAEIRLEYCYTHLCDEAVARNPHLRRLDGRTVAKIVPRIEKFTDLLP